MAEIANLVAYIIYGIINQKYLDFTIKLRLYYDIRLLFQKIQMTLRVAVNYFKIFFNFRSNQCII